MSVRGGRAFRPGRAVGTYFDKVSTKPEKKYDDTNLAFSMDSTSGATNVQLALTIAQGANYNQRVGSRIVVKSIRAKMTAAISGGNFADNAFGRFMLVWDSQPNGALASIDLSINPQGILTGVGVNSHPNVLANERFTILCDRTWAFQANAENEEVFFDRYIKINKEVCFGSAGTGVISDIQKGALLMATTGNLTAVGGLAPQGNVGIRVVYQDA